MAISEEQLETWSHQGSKVQSAATYAAVKSVLCDSEAPYASRNFDVFLQGSYGNDTNIYAESDVDVVICLSDAYNADISDLDSDEKAAYEADRSTADYGFMEFRKEVISWLTHNFGPGVKLGKKAILVPGTNGRRDADVLACIVHKRFTSYRSSWNSCYHTGIYFRTTSGTKIINFPKQHSDNCTTKHQETQSRFKANVRVLKNMRKSMVSANWLADGVAPSYFIEGMLWNVPSQNFAGSYQQTIENCLYWLELTNPTQLVCANDLHWLIRDGAAVCWNTKDFQEFLSAARQYWNLSGR